MAHKQPIPDTDWGGRQTRVLYNRFHSLKGKAKARGIPFEWDDFPSFVKAVQESAPSGYTPERYSIRFNLSDEKGYRKDGMIFYPGKSFESSPRPHGTIARSTVKEKARQGVAQFDNTKMLMVLVSELVLALLTEESDLDALLDQVKGKVNEILEREHHV